MVREHQGAVRAFLQRLSRDPARADDLAQTAFLKAFEATGRLRDPKSAKAWLFQIAYRTFIDEYRKTQRRDALAETQIEEAASQTNPALAADIARAMDALPPDCRAVVMLCLAYGMSHSEAAKITSMPLGTVKSHVLRGKTQLRAFLSAYERA